MGPTVRTVRSDELDQAARVVAHGMLGAGAAADVARFSAHAEPARTLGAFRDDGRLVGTARWFPTTVSTTGPALPAAAVTSVAVLNTDRRQGHLTRMMAAQLQQVADEGLPVAVLIAAEAPIYGRFGYGSMAMAADLLIDATATSFRHGPTGQVTLVEPDELRPALEACHDARLRRTPGGITRPALHWDEIANLVPIPEHADGGHFRGAVWHDDDGRLAGAVSYQVTEHWERYRPRGRARVLLLVGATAEAERELWRHVVELDWVASVEAPWRAVDDPLPLWLQDPRTAALTVASDVAWVRILDLPTTISALRAPVERSVVAEVVDESGGTAGVWHITLGPDGSEAQKTGAPADVRLPIRSMGACFLGGYAVPHLHETGWLDELAPGGVTKLATVFTNAVRPWCPTDF